MTDFYQKATTPLSIIIVGGGLGGLSSAYVLGRSGHSVTVLEAAAMKEVGAGLNAVPNLTRMLSRWGLEPYTKRNSMALYRLELRRWQSGEYLGAATWMPEVEERFGAPQYAGHRADFLNGIIEAIQQVPNVKLRPNCRVVDVDFHRPSVTLQDGRVLTADVIVGADGLKSICRRLLYQNLGLVDKSRPTGDAAFRAMIPIERITDPEIINFVQTPVATRWMGPGRHVQAFPIRNHTLYNMVLCHPDTVGSVESWDARASKKEILDNFGDWDPYILRKLIDLIPEENVLKWQLCDHDELPTWVMGKMVLLGDACHPMLPYVAQGAAQAVEDVGVLSLALNQVDATHPITTMLKTYELSRKVRAHGVSADGVHTRLVLHYPDGPEQETRDAKFRRIAEGGDNPDLHGNREAQEILWGYDPEKIYLDNLENLIEQAEKVLGKETGCEVAVVANL